MGSNRGGLQKYQRHIVLIIVAMITVPFISPRANAQAPWSSVVWMRFSDNAFPSDSTTVFFGDGYGATYCIDSLNPTIREFESPPVPPSIFEILFKNIPSRSSSTCYGLGLLRYDFYGYSGPTQIDTFKIAFANYDSSGATWHIRWPSATYLAARCDSILLVDPTGKMQPSKVNMMKQDSLILVAPGDSGISSFLIFKYGSVIIDGVSDRLETAPAQAILNQNYPNPFNPSTQMSYTVPHESQVTLTIYDVLGREVATLVNEKKQPGEYSLQWKADGMPGGVYFYRLAAGTFVAVKKMVIVR